MSDINWKDGAVCCANGKQLMAMFSSSVLNDINHYDVSFESALNQHDFQLNELREGDFIPASEIDTEQKYNEVVEVFGLFGFKRFEDIKFKVFNSAYLAVDSYLDLSGMAKKKDNCKRQLTYHQIIAIGKLKRMMLDKVEAKSINHQTLGNKVTTNKYEREITDRQGNSATVDVYDVIIAYGVTCPATQHAIKKLLCTGDRGHKDTLTDLSEARDAITRAIELN